MAKPLPNRHSDESSRRAGRVALNCQTAYRALSQAHDSQQRDQLLRDYRAAIEELHLILADDLQAVAERVLSNVSGRKALAEDDALMADVVSNWALNHFYRIVEMLPTLRLDQACDVRVVLIQLAERGL